MKFTKHTLAVIIAGWALVLVSAAYATLTLKGEVNRLEPKAAKFDEVCNLAKTALQLDRRRLADPRTRDPMLSDFAGYNLGDGYAMLDWCIPHTKEFVEEVRRCSGLDDYACVERVFRAMEATIP